MKAFPSLFVLWTLFCFSTHVALFFAGFGFLAASLRQSSRENRGASHAQYGESAGGSQCSCFELDFRAGAQLRLDCAPRYGSLHQSPVHDGRVEMVMRYGEINRDCRPNMEVI